MIYNDLEQNIVNRAAKELSNEIDFHVLADLYLREGWTEVNLPRQPREKDNIIAWFTSHNIHCYGRDQRWLFKKQKDAVFLSLRWG